tara:strand:+ start:3410 stop:4600 length:1191 start_codon:yes stop_codon:yes gene_type:complete
MSNRFSRFLMISVALGGLSACSTSNLDWDLRGLTGGSLDTRDAALQATQSRPRPDGNGVLSYPGYQVVVARRGDTVRDVANRIGTDPQELARYNALKPDDLLRADELLALPRRVEAAQMIAGAAPPGGTASGAIIGGPIATTRLDVTSVASGALDRAAGSAPSVAPPAPAATQPARHQVKRGETAYSISRSYNISVRALAQWNGLGPDLNLREGQYLLIPLPTDTAPGAGGDSAPGQGSATPVPPSAALPLPAEKTLPTAAKDSNTPKSPDLGQQRTTVSASAYTMPVEGKIIRGYAKGRSEGIDIAAPAGTTVRAAADGTVAAITKDTDQVPILVIRHADNLLSVYAGIDAVRVAKGAKVTRGQSIAVVRKASPSFLHFELRKGVDSIDPMTKLQ